MAKKKKSRRQRTRIQRLTTPAETAAAPPSTASSAAPAAPPAARLATPRSTANGTTSTSLVTDRWSYVRRDLRRLGVLAISCIALEIIVWLLFTYTSLGTTVYGLIKL